MQIKYRTQFGELLQHFGLQGHGVEIGVAEGRNAQVLIQSPAITKLYLIDAWTRLNQKGDGGSPQSWHDGNYEEMLQRTQLFENKRVVLRGLSSEMINTIPDDSLIFAYVDGDHSYEGCLNDLRAIWPKLKSGAILAGHDFLNHHYGVHRAVETFSKEILKDNNHILIVNMTEEDGDKNMVSFWFQKTTDLC